MGKHLKKPASVRVSDETMTLWNEMAALHGGKEQALAKGLAKLKDQRNAITPKEALEALAIAHGLEPPRKKRAKRS